MGVTLKNVMLSFLIEFVEIADPLVVSLKPYLVIFEIVLFRFVSREQNPGRKLILTLKLFLVRLIKLGLLGGVLLKCFNFVLCCTIKDTVCLLFL